MPNNGSTKQVLNCCQNSFIESSVQNAFAKSTCSAKHVFFFYKSRLTILCIFFISHEQVIIAIPSKRERKQVIKVMTYPDIEFFSFGALSCRIWQYAYPKRLYLPTNPQGVSAQHRHAYFKYWRYQHD
jgi:hypothetical protein